MLGPGAYSLAERDEIALDSEASAAFADVLMKDDFAKMSYPTRQNARPVGP